jgi:hypothetical protein
MQNGQDKQPTVNINPMQAATFALQFLDGGAYRARSARCIRYRGGTASGDCHRPSHHRAPVTLPAPTPAARNGA